jgi:hypothetical protein
MEQFESAATTLNRRRFVQAAVGTVAGAGLAGGAVLPAAAHATDSPKAFGAEPPKPIPGGQQIPGGPLLHGFAPGPTNLTLPFSGAVPQGLDVDPSTFTDFRGFAAMAYHVGTARGSDGKTYNLETDVRAYRGTYVDATGARRSAAFSFI